MRLKKILISLLVLGVFGPAAAEERIALIVGNGSYTAVTQLDNPVPDASLMARTLEQQGFQVTLLTDSDQGTLNRSIAQFGRDLRNAGSEATGLFYYAGHGVQSFGTNYLVPVDASLTNAADLGLVAVEAETVLRQMFSAKNKTNIVILDACRNNPFQDLLDMDDNGLAEMKAPTGTFLAYSTAPGAVALDGLDGNSPFTQALAAELVVPGVPIEQVFKQVRVNVLEISRGAQTPWDTSSLTDEFFFIEPVSMSAEQLAELQLWDSVRASEDPVQIMLFLRAYPGSEYETEARTLLGDVMNRELNTPTAPKVAVVPPKPVAPVDREQQLIDIAQASGAVEDYQAYIAEFPGGVYAELAQYEVTVLIEKGPTGGLDPESPLLEQAETAPPEPVAPAATIVTFTVPLTVGDAGILGKSIADLILGSPLFPPVEGIPEEYWKDKQCSNCHQWTREALCTQAHTYLALNTQRAISKQHPFGGTFKQNLKTWASGGCE